MCIVYVRGSGRGIPLASQADEDDGFIDAIDDEVADVSRSVYCLC